MIPGGGGTYGGGVDQVARIEGVSIGLVRGTVMKFTTTDTMIRSS